MFLRSYIPLSLDGSDWKVKPKNWIHVDAVTYSETTIFQVSCV